MGKIPFPDDFSNNGTLYSGLVCGISKNDKMLCKEYMSNIIMKFPKFYDDTFKDQKVLCLQNGAF